MSVTIVNKVLLSAANDTPLQTRTKGPGEKDGDPCDLTTALAARDFALLIMIVKRDVQWNYHSDVKATDRIIRAARKAGKTLELDQADYDWLTKKVEEHGWMIWAGNTTVVREAFDDKAPKEPKEKKA